MCGIIGYIGTKDAVPVIVEGLKRLEYRGYDSSGIAVMTADGFDVVKQRGRLTELEKALKKHPLSGNLGIGHTRWATHGEPSDKNAHPHLGNENKIAVVHNGIIENYKTLKERLQAKGVAFHSETDSEVIAQLAESYYNGDLLKTVAKVANSLEGSFALGIMSADAPDTLIAVKKDNPLIIGVAEHGAFIASDVPAVLNHTNKVYYLGDKEIAVLKCGQVCFYNLALDSIEKTLETVTWSADAAEKGGYTHFMLKEIMEQPKTVRDTLSSTLNGENKKVLDNVDVTKFNKLVITACGSAYNAGMVGKYVIEKLARLNVDAELASEFRYKDAIVDDKTLVILVSQSGETADTAAALREAKKKGAKTLAIVNVVGSAIAKEADYTLLTVAGPEIAVATTKAYSAQLIVLYLLAIRFAFQRGLLTEKEQKKLVNELSRLPDKVSEILTHQTTMQKYAASCVGYKSIFFIGRNIDYAISLEGSLKLKEISYIHSEAYAGGELKHGTISLIEEDTLVVAISTLKGLLHDKIMSNAEQVLSRGARVLMLGECNENEKHGHLTHFSLPEANELFMPSISVIALQLFAYYVAANKGLDIDKPRNLAKSVTVE